MGSSVKACSVRYWHALPPCLSAACQWTPRCCNVPYCCCQHSRATDTPRRGGTRSTCERLHATHDIRSKEMLPPLSERSRRRAASNLSRRTHLLLPALLLKRHSDCNNVKSTEKLTLYKEYKKDLTNYRLYSARIHCTQHIWL